MRPKTKAYLVEWTDYGDPFWEFGSINWDLESAVESAESIPFTSRIREVEITLGELVNKEAINKAREDLKIWDKILKNLDNQTQ